MAVDNPYTGGKSSLEDLARMRSLKRSFAIAHKEGQENVRRARNVNDAADPSWEVSQRLRDRMTATVAGYLPQSLYSNNVYGKPGHDLVEEELTVARDAGYRMQENVLIHSRAARKAEKRLGITGKSFLETSTSTSPVAAIQYAGAALGSLFRKARESASEIATAKRDTEPPKTDTGDTKRSKKPAAKPLTVAPAQLNPVPGADVNKQAAPKDDALEFNDAFMSSFALGLAADGNAKKTLADFFNVLPQTMKDQYSLGKLDSSSPYLQYLHKEGYDKTTHKGKRPVQFSFLNAKMTSNGNVAVSVGRDNRTAFRVIVPFDSARMQLTEYGNVKVFASPAVANGQKTLQAAARAQGQN